MTAHRKLLADYAANGSEQAFGELVRLYINLVYSTALRSVGGDRHRAEDIVQIVFTDLARLSGTLSEEVLLGGWLHRRTCHVAAHLLRGERRRQEREKKAMELQALRLEDQSTFQSIAPVLDEAINHLGSADRAAIVLRFFEGCDLQAVGQALGTNEDAAQKRVSRALEKLKRLLGPRGASLSRAGLAAILLAEATTAAPVGLAASVSAAALAGVAAASSGGVILGIAKFMIMEKLKVTAGVLVMAGLGTTLVLQHQAQQHLRQENRSLRQQLAALPQPQAQLEPLPGQPTAHIRLPAPPMPTSAPLVEGPAENAAPTNLIARLLQGQEPPPVNLRELEPYLERNRRSAESLLAAFRLSGERALLQEALEKYPADPAVNYAAVFASQSSEERRQRLESLKQSDPDNALANYLSAQDYFKSGQTDQAVQDLEAALDKHRFHDYSKESVQNAEEAYRAIGYSEAEAKATAALLLQLPQLAELRRLAQNLGQLANLYQQASDAESAQAVREIGLGLGRRVGDLPAGQRTTIHDMVGLRIQQCILEGVDPASPAPGTGLTVRDYLAGVQQSRAAYVHFGKQEEALLPRLSEPDLISFFDRLKVFGEREAFQWVINRQAARQSPAPRRPGSTEPK